MSWPLVPFNEVVKDVTSGNDKIKSKDYLSIGILPIIDQGKQFIGGYIDDLSLACKANLPVIVFGDHTKEIKYLDQSFALGADGVKILKPSIKNLNEKYLFYYLKQAKLPDDAGYSRHFKFLKRLQIPLPPLEEQKRIAAILDQANAVRLKRQQTIQLGEQFLRSVFLDMFGDPITNPKGLPTSSLIEVSKKVTDGTHQSPVWSETGIPFLFISNIVNNEISFQVDKYITEKNWLELTKNSPIEEGDVLYTTVGSYGNAALVKDNTRFCFQRHIAHIKPIKNIIHPTFLWVMMNSPGIKKQADKQARGIAQKTLNLGELKQFIIFVPPMSKQIEFVNIVTQHKAILNKLIAKFSLANNLFNSLTQQVFSGELNNQTKVEST